MNNYHYIVAGLPDLVLSADNKEFSFDSIRDEIYRLCSATDRRLIDWLEFGSCPDHLGTHFYKKALNCKNGFIRGYFGLDLLIRNRKVSYLAGREQSRELDEKYGIRIDTPFELTSDDDKRLLSVFETSDILRKEQSLDQFKWDWITQYTRDDLFNINTILAFLAKGKLIDRWNKLDKQVGEEMFKKLVNEVKGTFKGIDFNENNK